MRSKLKRVLPAFIVFTLLFAIFATFAFAANGKNRNDYSRPGYSAEIYNETFDATAFLRQKLNVSVGAVEEEYLAEKSSFYLSYPKNIPSSYVTLYPMDNQAFVRAKPYSYTNSEGVSITWIPTKVSVENQSSVFSLISGGDYQAGFSGFTVENGHCFSVEYNAVISIDFEDINRELSRAYLDGKYLDYLEKRLEYEAALEIYNEYLSDKKIYEELYLEYTEYLSDLKKYEEALLKYNEYLLVLQKYEEDYLLYFESLKAAEELADEIAAYNEYLLKMEKINYRLSLVDDMKINKTSLKRSLFGAITGNAVDQVLSEQDILTGNVIDADKAVVEGAGDATEAIREFFDEYFSRDTDSAKYQYYQMNYLKLKNNIVKLFQCLDNLYENGFIRGIIESKDRSDKFEILLSQLYYAANALSDETVYNYKGTVAYDENYHIETTKGPKTPAQILGDVSDYYVDKNIATPPADEAYPVPVPAPNYVPVPEPTKPEKVEKPSEPQEVKEPIAPAVVEEPTAPTEVENANAIETKAPIGSGTLEGRLLDAYRRGMLSSRSDRRLVRNYEMSLGITVAKVVGASEAIVTYHDHNGNPIGDLSVEKGTFAEIEHVPEKAGNAQYSYVFDKWLDAPEEEGGRAVNLSSVETDMLIYPSFKRVVNKYGVTWKIDGTVVKSELLEYGSAITEWIPEKAGDLNKYYTFISWSPAISPVTENVTYTAVFEEKYTVPGLSDGSIVKSGDTEISVTLDGNLGERFDVSRLLEISSGKYSVKFLLPIASQARASSDSAEFTVSYADVVAMKKASVAFLEFSVLKENDSERYAAFAYDKDGKPVEQIFKLSVAVPSEKNHADMRVVYYQSEEKLYAKSEYSDGKIRFNLNTGCHYSYILEIFPSLISVFPQEIKVLADKTEAIPGEFVSLSIDLPLGVELVSFYYVDASGAKVLLPDGKFAMPDFDVIVGAEIKKTLYTVNFVSDGIIISSRQYYYGDTVEIPDGIVKASDEKYSYKFLRWAPSVAAVTQNVSYEAVYEKTPIVKDDDGGLKISEGTLRIIIVAGIFALVVFLAIVPNIVISLILASRRKKSGTFILGKRKNT